MDSDRAKVFVGGISGMTNEEALAQHFGKYGEVVSTVIMRDRITGSTRGFGFVSFASPLGLDKVFKEEHVILGRAVEVKKAVPRGDQHQHQNHQQNKRTSRNNGCTANNSSNDGDPEFRTRKIFVGGLPPSLTEEEFKNYFEKFGKTTDVVVMYDGVTHRPRGFGFITFDSEEAVENVTQKTFHELNDKLVEVKRAVPKDGGNTGSRTNGHNYGARMDNGRGSSFYGYGPGIYWPYGSRYGIYQNYYGPSPIYGFGDVGGYSYGSNGYGGVYSMGPYGGVAYGGPVTPSTSPWNGFGMAGTRQNPGPYNSPLVYPGYTNGAVGVGGYMNRGMMGPSSEGRRNQGGEDWQTFATGAQNATAPMSEGLQLGNDSFNFRGQKGQDVRLRL